MGIEQVQIGEIWLQYHRIAEPVAIMVWYELRCEPEIKEVVDVSTGEPLPWVAPGRFGLHGKGRLLLRIPDYFSAAD